MATEKLNVELALKVNTFLANMMKVERASDRAMLGINKASRQADNAIKEITKDTMDMAKGFETAIRNVNDLSNAFNSLAKGYIGFTGLSFIAEQSDKIISAENKLNYVVSTDLEADGVSSDKLFDVNGGYTDMVTSEVQSSMNKIYSASMRARGNYSDMLADVSKLSVLAGGAFDDNIDNVIRFQETMAKAYTVGGASAQEMHSSMYQLTQALGAGILAGDELRSVREGAPLAYQEIEKFAQAIYDTDKPLKDMASRGMITSDIVVNAIMGASGKMDDAFSKTALTFGQTANLIKSTATKSFQPVFESLANILSSESGQAMINATLKAIEYLGYSCQIGMQLLETIVNYISNNLNYVLAGMSLALFGIAMQLGGVVVSAVIKFIGALKAVRKADPFAKYLIAIGILIALFPLFSKVAVGAITFVGVVIANLFITIFNLAKEAVNVFILLASTILTVFAGIGTALGQLLNREKVTVSVDTVLSDVKKLWSDFDKGENQIFGITETIGLETVTNAVNKTDEFTNGLYDSVGNFIGDTFGNVLDKYGIKRLIDINDPSNVLDLTDTNSLLSNIADSTDKTATNTSLADEDLKWLRDVAEMEWKKEFTTASITIDMNNNNTINNTTDLEGLVTQLTDIMYDQMYEFSDGVYA